METIRERRKAMGLTQKQLAKLIDVTESQVSQIENGKRNPGFETLLKLGEVFGCSVDDIVRNKKIPATVTDDEDLEDPVESAKKAYFDSLFDKASPAVRDEVIGFLLQKLQNQ